MPSVKLSAGAAIEAQNQPLKAAHDLDEALDSYTTTAWEVDLHHRHFEQLRHRLLTPTLPNFNGLLAAAESLRQRYRAWADHLARDFASLCEREGFLPSPGRQQRTLYEQVVHPLLADGGRVAVFLVDALRFEMARELARSWKGPAAASTSKHA